LFSSFVTSVHCFYSFSRKIHSFLHSSQNISHRNVFRFRTNFAMHFQVNGVKTVFRTTQIIFITSFWCRNKNVDKAEQFFYGEMCHNLYTKNYWIIEQKCEIIFFGNWRKMQSATINEIEIWIKCIWRYWRTKHTPYLEDINIYNLYFSASTFTSIK